MFATFVEIPLSKSTHQFLFTSWKDYIIRRSRPYRSNEYRIVKTVDSWWLSWLIESVEDRNKGVNWFQAQITQWIDNLPKDRTQLGDNYGLLRLLTKDLTEIYHQVSGGQSI
jgi:hypothetical protein